MKRGFIYTISAFVISVIFLSTLAFLYTTRLEEYIDSRDRIDSSQSLIAQLYRVSYYLIDAEANQRSFLLSRDSSYITDYHAALDKVKDARDSLRTMIPERHNLRMKLNDLNLTLNVRVDEMNRAISRRTTDTSGLGDIVNLPLRSKLFELIQVMEQTEIHDQQVFLEKKNSYERVHNKEFRTLFVFALLIFFISFVVLLREIRLRTLYHRRMEDQIRQANQANRELERLAHITSHDLQEPLRKIRTFSNLLTSKFGNELNEEGRTIVSRIEHSADVGQEMVRDLGAYANLVGHEHKPKKIDLNEVMDEVHSRYNARIEEGSAIFTIQDLPVIKGYHDQLVLLFSSLMDNSLKFARENVPLHITVSHEMVRGDAIDTGEKSSENLRFHCITFRDNGLGFDEEFGEKIFGMFQRLHNNDTLFSGRGMGLAIVRRVMVNHSGHIVAKGKPGEGAQFSLYFPMKLLVD